MKNCLFYCIPEFNKILIIIERNIIKNPQTIKSLVVGYPMYTGN